MYFTIIKVDTQNSHNIIIYENIIKLNPKAEKGLDAAYLAAFASVHSKMNAIGNVATNFT